MSKPKIYGVSPSPFVRKVAVAMYEKAIDFEYVAQMPFTNDHSYLEKHPLGKIPCYEDEHITLPDSSCILLYLEKTHPQPALYPNNPVDYAQCLWLEEYADTQLLPVASVAFYERIVVKNIMKQEPNEKRIQEVFKKEKPKTFDYLEAHAPEAGWIIGDSFSVADIAIGSQLLNFFYAGEVIDEAQWPTLAAYVQRIHQRPSFLQCMESDAKQLKSS